MRTFISLISVLLIASSCVTVEFTEPQPARKKNLVQFPPELRGVFLASESGDEDFSSMDTLIIDRGGFTAITREEKTKTLAEIADDPDLRLVDSLIYLLDIDPRQGLRFHQEDSSLTYTYFVRERAVLSADSMILKKYRGNYYLNIKEEPNRYNLLLLKRERNEDIAAWTIKPKEEIDKFRLYTDRIEEIRNDEGKIEKYIASPKARELHKFVEAGGFTELVYRLHRID